MPVFPPAAAGGAQQLCWALLAGWGVLLGLAPGSVLRGGGLVLLGAAVLVGLRAVRVAWGRGQRLGATVRALLRGGLLGIGLGYGSSLLLLLLLLHPFVPAGASGPGPALPPWPP